MIYELYLEGQLADIRQDLGMQISYAIDDINKYGSRETSFSKTIVLPGTANNNKLLGFVSELGSNNTYFSGGANINSNFNPAQTTKAELRANGLLLLKGVFRLTGVVKDGELIEYEGNLFGELGGFISAIGNGKLEDLDFSEYNHIYSVNNIVGSWDSRVTKDVTGSFGNAFDILFYVFVKGYDLKLKVGDTIVITNSDNNNGTYTVAEYVYYPQFGNAGIRVNQFINDTSSDENFTIQYPSPDGFGTGFFYPLIDYGRYSAAKLNYDYRTFRPALFVKEYIDKMFAPTGYTYESSFFNSAFFKKLIIPNNAKQLEKIISKLIDATHAGTVTYIENSQNMQEINFEFNNILVIDNFTGDGNPNFIYTGLDTEIKIHFKLSMLAEFIYSYFGSYYGFINIQIQLNNQPASIYNETWQNLNNYPTNININIDIEKTILIKNNDTIEIQFRYQGGRFTLNNIYLNVDSTTPTTAPVQLNDEIILNSSIPRNILQKDFFSWILKMFNLYVTEDKVKEKHLLIEPYVDYYDLTEYEDWTYKVARDKPWNIKPMGMLNGRFFEYKYKEDNDFYNEGYKKKYNLPYGSNLQDTGFQFAKDKQTTEIGFSPTPLVKYSGKDKVVSAIYKVSKGNDVDQEEQTDSNIRILMIKKITGVAAWYITDNGVDLQQTPQNLGGSLTGYGYAGHFDDPTDPTVDINFGAAGEIYCQPNTYPSNNLFNTYWSGYIAEIADKDSKILTCHVYLTELDIAQLDFSKPVFIDGVLWRINKIMDFDASAGELTKVELLKVINNG